MKQAMVGGGAVPHNLGMQKVGLVKSYFPCSCSKDEVARLFV